MQANDCTLIWSIVVIGKSLIPEGHIKDCIKNTARVRMT
jgi:hypothetical protein